MRIGKAVLVLLVVSLLVPGMLHAARIGLYVDAAPNMYGAPGYQSWWSNAQKTAAAGTFINMANSASSSNIGTTNFDIRDAVVYNFGDLGKRLHFTYWIPGQTVAQLQGTERFKVSLSYTWNGATHDFYDEAFGSTWLEPASWKNLDADGNGSIDGVVGTAGFAWWGAYNTNTPEELAENLDDWSAYQGDIAFGALFDGKEYVLAAHHVLPTPQAPVPEPSTLALLAAGLAGAAAFRKKLRK